VGYRGGVVGGRLGEQRGFKKEGEHQDTEACTTSSSLVQEADWQSSAAYATYSLVKMLCFKARMNVSVQVIACRNLLITGAYFMKMLGHSLEQGIS